MPIKTNPIQSQNKPNQTQFQTQRLSVVLAGSGFWIRRPNCRDEAGVQHERKSVNSL